MEAEHFIYDGWDFSQTHTLDLSDYLVNDIISEYYGTYLLRIKVIDDNFYKNYNFTLSEFFIETVGWRQAEVLADTTAWITDPAKADTDEDGWTDYFEIFTKQTNPVSVDTDGDGAWDPVDRDPHRDLLIEILFLIRAF